jgi:hypothetical protein
MAQMEEPSKLEALSSNPNNAKTKPKMVTVTVYRQHRGCMY